MRPIEKEITVPACICVTGHFNETCPYAIETRLDEFFAEKEPVDSFEEVLVNNATIEENEEKTCT